MNGEKCVHCGQTEIFHNAGNKCPHDNPGPEGQWVFGSRKTKFTTRALTPKPNTETET